MENFLFDLSVVLGITAVLAFLAVLLRQPIIIAYIACGILLGPYGVGWIKHADFIGAISTIGIALLLFLAGLCLHPQKLMRLFKQTFLVTFGTSLVSFLIAFLLARLYYFDIPDSVCIGLALMFSSTILTVKLLPTTALHHQRMGALCIGVLILQDLMAVAVLAFLGTLDAHHTLWACFGILSAKLLIFVGALVVFEQFILRKAMLRIERLHELLFVVGLAWCFVIASASKALGLSFETGAFFAGVVLARHPISLFISERLKPLRDFFLVLFFFTLGANLNLLIMKGVFLQALLMTLAFIIVKPWLFKKFFKASGEPPAFSQEIGIRLGQMSEFALLIATLALALGHITIQASQLIQLVTILSFIASGYIVVLKYQTPIGTSERLIKD